VWVVPDMDRLDLGQFQRIAPGQGRTAALAHQTRIL
jgi:hypothetical protein